jgi:hypothetical protein
MSSTGFDPDEPDDSARRSQYMSARDIKVLGIIILVLLALLWPIYNYYRGVSERYRCKQNFKDIFEAMGLYSAEWNDRYPPLYVIAPGQKEAPLLDAKNRPFTWASLIQRFARKPDIFRCPSATEEEVLLAQDPSTTKKSLPMTYGMYVGLALEPTSLVRNPATTILAAETSNYGAHGSFNPVPLHDNDGKPIPFDGFLIGYSDSNLVPSTKTVSVTRLAFEGSKNGFFSQHLVPRHPNGNWYLFAGGQVGFLGADVARVKMLGSDPTGYWERP